MIELHFAKTVTRSNLQQLQLTATNNCLCPIKALLGQVASRKPTDSLFAVNKEMGRKNLIKIYCKRRLQEVWRSIMTLLLGRRCRSAKRVRG
jgi:hypothetical protein